jgi:hypothetical protein
MRVSLSPLGLPAALALLSLLAPTAGAQEPPPEVAPSFSVAPDLAPPGKGGAGMEPSTGSFVRLIPIEAPSFHGIEPRLALAYSSQAGNGFVGVGWRLGGFSVVERTRNGRGTPRFTSDDVFVLDGQELLPCSTAAHSPGCLAGGTHATKQESYARIRFDASTGTWVVWARNGVRTELAPVYQASGGTLRWGQSRTIDTHGSVVTYAWECVGGDCYPASVAYGPFVVTLFREDQQRPDVLSFATGGPSGLGKTRYRLRTILVARGSASIRAYRLGYVQSPATSRSLLREVQQYGTDVQVAAGVVTAGTALPAQSFRYQGAE